MSSPFCPLPVQWFPERFYSDTHLLTTMAIVPSTRSELLTFVERINRIARQIELEGVPTSMDWPFLSISIHRAAVLLVLRHRMAMRSELGNLN